MLRSNGRQSGAGSAVSRRSPQAATQWDGRAAPSTSASMTPPPPPPPTGPPPVGTKRRALEPIDDIAEEVDSEDSWDSAEEEYEPPPPRSRGPGPRGPDGGLRANPQRAPERYWDHESHMEACRRELAELTGEGITWDEIDASEGDSNCDIQSEDDDEEEEEAPDNNNEHLEDPSPNL